MWATGSHGTAQPDTNRQVCSRPHCEFCNTEIPVGCDVDRLRCVHCNANYCSKEHKKADFRFHKQRCLNFPATQSTNDSNWFLTDSLPDTNSQQYGQSNYNSAEVLPLYQQQVNPDFTGQLNQLNPLDVQESCQVDKRNLMSSSQLEPSTVSPQLNQKEPYNCQFYQTQSETQPRSFQPQLSSIPTNETQTPAPTSTCVENVTVQNAPIEILDPNPSNDEDQIPLDDALVSFLQDAQDGFEQGRLPRNLSGLLRNFSNPNEDQIFYDDLLSLESTSKSNSQTKIDPLEVKESKDAAEISLQSYSDLYSAVDCEGQVNPRMCQQFGLKKQDSSNVLARNLSLEEEGIFPRYNINDVANYIVKSLHVHNHCIIDYLHGVPLATAILEEVKQFHCEKNGFSEGRLSTPGGREGTPNKAIREDLVVWTDGNGRKAIKKHMSRVDFLMKLCNRFITETEICSRTQAMIACYPGKGTGYKQHVDNPNKDGRCITTLYYLNPNWNIQADGGILKLFPNGINRKTVIIEPIFDRLLLFWSDKRTPHEVTPAFKVRYAITLWYFNDEERKKYIQRYKEGKT